MVEFVKLDEKAVLPVKHHESDAGVDLSSLEDVKIFPGDSVIVGTGIGWITEERLTMIVKSRSGMAFKYGIEASNAGVIDRDYRGEIKVKLYNTSDRPVQIFAGDRVAQGVILAIPKIEITTLSDGDRGDKGFGSSDDNSSDDREDNGIILAEKDMWLLGNGNLEYNITTDTYLAIDGTQFSRDKIETYRKLTYGVE